ncbi:hypothetical protein CFN17_13875 [Arthrobacter sp. PM3]|nr:hypothetical protein CFN17_13875 [Arthrobacter sp. PM3]
MLPRYALLACLALVVMGLGIALTPSPPPEPAEPPFSEQARADALTQALRLRTAGSRLNAAAGKPAAERTVTLLTTQAQALLLPGESPLMTAPAESTAADSAAPAAGPPSAAPSSAPLPATAAELVTALADSGRRRLADAALADGGMARLLAAVGTGQLLQAADLAAGTGTAAPPMPEIAVPELAGACPSAPDAAGATASAAPLDAALAAVVRAEEQTIYGYQVALPRLDGDAAVSATAGLARHDALLAGAETLTRQHCSNVPPREPGYTLGKSFLASPAAGLGNLEAAALPAYGDLIALGDGPTRQWAIAALLGSGHRAVLWGADPGALPGLASEALASLPPLPPG